MMTRKERLVQIMEILETSKEPISATDIGKILNVTRQTIVVDISLLRADGYRIKAGYYGYTVDKDEHIYPISVSHKACDIYNELSLIIEQGGEVVDVWIEHPNYGDIKGELHIKTLEDISKYTQTLNNPLLNLTNGVHNHNIRCHNLEHFQNIKTVLKSHNFLVE